MINKEQKYVIGIDGGGTKTVAALANLKGKILKIGKAGPSSPRNVEIKMAVKNITQAIKKILVKKGKILSTFIGLAAVEEEPKFKREIKRALFKQKEISKIFKGKLIIGSDQIVAFRSGTDKKEGIVLISGTGCVAHGWREKKEAQASGWGWLADEGSAFWTGQKGLQAIWKDLDDRGEKTEIKKLLFEKWKIKNKEDFMKKTYEGDLIRNISLISKIIDDASKMGDRMAISIMKEAGRELVLTTISVIKKLNFQKIRFPLVLVGSVFNSKIVLDPVKKEIKKVAPKSLFIRPKVEPVIGAVKLAIEQI